MRMTAAKSYPGMAWIANNWGGKWPQGEDEMRAALAEIDRLRVENERLKSRVVRLAQFVVGFRSSHETYFDGGIQLCHKNCTGCRAEEALDERG